MTECPIRFLDGSWNKIHPKEQTFYAKEKKEKKKKKTKNVSKAIIALNLLNAEFGTWETILIFIYEGDIDHNFWKAGAKSFQYKVSLGGSVSKRRWTIPRGRLNCIINR